MKWFRSLGVAVLVFVLDQTSKFLVRFFEPDTKFITFVWNSGAAFSLFQNSARLLGVIGLIVSIAVLVIIHKSSNSEKLKLLFLGIFLGGVLGNAIDRLVFGSVVDFINPQVWPVFNIADAAAIIGVLGLLYLEFKK